MNLLLVDFFLKELHTGCFRAANTSQTLVVDLQGQLVDLTLKGPLADSLAFKFALKLIDLGLERALLTVKVLNLCGQLLLVGTGDVQALDGLLDVLDAPLLLLLKHAPFFLVLGLALFPVGIQLVLVLLFNLQFGELKFPLFILTSQGDLLLFALEFSFILLGQGALILCELVLPFLFEPFLLTAYDFILLTGMLAQLSLDVGLQLLLELLHIVAQKTTGVFGLELNFLLHLR